MEVTEGMKEKVQDMLLKHERFFDEATKIRVEIRNDESYKGVKEDLTVEVTVAMPKAFIRVEESGEDFYVVVDKIDPVLRRRLVRYNDHKSQWEGRKSWKEIEQEKLVEGIEDEEVDDYNDADESVENLITRHKKYSQNSPMSPSEAIERMELLGHEAFLFKNRENDDGYSMVYKRKNGTYGLVEPKDD